MSLKEVTFVIFLFFTWSEGTVIRLTKYEGRCKDHPNVKAYYTNIKIFEKDGKTYFDQSLNVTKEIPDIDRMLIIARRCPSRDDLDHCENFRNVTIPNFKALTTLSGPWAEKFAYKPPLSFPLEPGLYVAQTTIIDRKWGVIASKGYWRNYAKMLTRDGKVVICVYCEGEIYD